MDKKKPASGQKREPNISSSARPLKNSSRNGKQPDSAQKHKNQQESVQSGKKSWLFWAGIVFSILLALGFGWLFLSQRALADASQVKIDPNLVRYTVPIEGNPSRGPENAPITLVEFSDYQCPYCTEWFKDVYPNLMKDYKDKIRFVHKDFPLYAIHPDSLSAAEAADCAGEQNSYWAYHDALYGGKYGLGMSAYQNYASDLGLNLENFNKCLSDHRYKNSIDANVTFGASLGITSTPTFFLNGMAIVGAQPYDVFKQIIDKELAGEIKK